jgi:hypothetical protein
MERAPERSGHIRLNVAARRETLAAGSAACIARPLRPPAHGKIAPRSRRSGALRRLPASFEVFYATGWASE